MTPSTPQGGSVQYPLEGYTEVPEGEGIGFTSYGWSYKWDSNGSGTIE